jgi:hypothetical protein
MSGRARQGVEKMIEKSYVSIFGRYRVFTWLTNLMIGREEWTGSSSL